MDIKTSNKTQEKYKIQDLLKTRFIPFPAVLWPLLHISLLIPRWIPYEYSATAQLYHNFEFNQGLTFCIRLFVCGIWGFFEQSRDLSSACVTARQSERERERACEREEGSLNSLSSTWTLDTVPYVIFTHFTCQRADVSLVWRTNMCSKCVSATRRDDLTPACIYVHVPRRVLFWIWAICN